MFEEFRQKLIKYVDEIFINLFLIVHEKLLNIPNDKEEDFNDYIIFGNNVSFLAKIQHMKS